MGTGDKSSDMTSYIGISGPDTPKYLLANNFLAEFFASDLSGREIPYAYEDFRDAKILLCEEDDEQKKKQLEQSFDCFLGKFSGDSLVSFREKKHFYFPIKPQMLCSTNSNLRHLHYCMIPGIEDEGTFFELQGLLYQYLYDRADGVGYLVSLLFEKYFETCMDKDSCKRDKKRKYEFDLLRAGNFSRVRKNFKEDLYKMLQHPYFRNLDFYKRYDYLAVLLDFYVIQFIINKKAAAFSRGYVLCQGSSHLSGCDSYHRACVQNYSKIRAVFQAEMKEYYLECLRKELKDGDSILIKNSDKGIFVAAGSKREEFIVFVRRVLNSNFKEKAAATLYPAIRNVFALDGTKEKEYTVAEFVMYYIDVSNARKGSTLTKISSALNTSGKDIEFVFPKTRSKFKYFALSPSLLEFLVRLYLALQDSPYAYLDNFLDFLQDKYGICIQKNARMDSMLKSLHVKVPYQEFRLNEQALIDSLDEISCLVRLSDSGYVVTLPEEKGEFALL